MNPEARHSVTEALAAIVRRRCPRCGAGLVSGEAAETPPSSRPRPLGPFTTTHLAEVARGDVPTIRSTENFSALPRLFAETGTDYAVVVDDASRALGIVTPALIFRNIADHGRASLTELHALDASSAGALFMRGGTDLGSALERFLSDPAARCIVVLGDDERFIGIVTHREALAALARDVWAAEAPTMPGAGT